jgi:hypothetical protein
MLVLSIVHTSKRNAYFLALLLPLFSFLISAHPQIPKMFLICSELTLNVWLFQMLREKISNNFISMFLSIVVSKIYYYLIKLLLLSFTLLSGELFSTPLFIQLSVGIILSLYVYITVKEK